VSCPDVLTYSTILMSICPWLHTPVYTALVTDLLTSAFWLTWICGRSVSMVTSLIFCWPCIIVYQYGETNVKHFLLNLLRMKGLYMFRALLAHPQEAIQKRHLVYCMLVTSVGCTSVGVFHGGYTIHTEMVTRLLAGRPGFRGPIRGQGRDFLFTAATPALELILKLHLSWINLPELESDHSGISTVGVRKRWSWACTGIHPNVFLAWCRLQHRDNPTLYFMLLIPSHLQTLVVAVPVSGTIFVMRNDYRSL
jgi:hypothetical protein